MTTSFGITWDGFTIDRRLTALVIAALMLAGMGPAALRAAGTEGALIPVIVLEVPGAGTQPERLVAAAGGVVGDHIKLIRGFTADVPAGSLATLSRSPGIRSITPDARVRMLAVDPALGYDAGDDGSPFSVSKAVGAQALWTAGTTGRGVDVALIDTGVSPSDALAGRVINGPDLSFESQADNLRYLDSYGHGTHMAGLIAGRDPRAASAQQYASSFYFMGIAPDARILSVKVGGYDGATDVSQVIAAIDWVVQHRRDGDLDIRVLNLSFGTDGVQDYLLDPLAYAAEVAWHKGIVVVVAAGNEGFGNQRLNNPAYDPYVIAVGADDMNGSIGSGNDLIPDFSSRGDARRGVDFVAPGKRLISLRSAGSWIDEHNPGGRVGDDYIRGSGTSQAAAVVSGAAALLLQRRPDLSPDQVKCLFARTAKKMPSADPAGKGAGLINVEAAANAPVPADCTQLWPRATGLGSLDAARGSVDIYEDGIALTGEVDIFGEPFDGAEWTGRSWTGTSWVGGDWMGRSWTGDSWCADGWTGRSWTGRSWTGRSWTGRSWTGRSWTGRSWTGRSWTGEAWAGRSWTSDTWAGDIWSGAGWGP